MHFLRVCVSVLAAVSVIVTAIFTIADFSRKNPPVIKCDSGEIIEVPTKTSDKELLKYVTAFDEEDGDLTENIIVERQNYSASQVVIDDSEFNPEKAGTYNVFFSIKSGSSTVTKTRMIVVVDGGGN